MPFYMGEILIDGIDVGMGQAFWEQIEVLESEKVQLQESVETLTEEKSTLESEVSTLEGEITEGKSLVANAITEKGVTTASDATFQTMADNIGNISTGVDINGVIEQYKVYAGNNISAGDFVSFVQNMVTDETTQLSSTNNTSYYINVTQLSDTTAFIVYGGTSSTLYGMVVTLSGNTITTSAEKTLTSGSSNGNYCGLVALSSTEVFLAYNKGSGSYSSMSAVVCTISGNTFTVGTATSLRGESLYAYKISATKLKSTSVMIVYSSGDNAALYGKICTIARGKVTGGTEISLGTLGMAYSNLVALSSTSVFISGEDSSYNIYGLVCTINGTTITKGTAVKLNNTTTSYSGGKCYPIMLSGGAFSSKMIVFQAGGRSNCIRAFLCNISILGSQASITVVNELTIPFSQIMNDIVAIKINDSKVFLVGTSTASSNYSLKSRICTIKDDNIYYSDQVLHTSTSNNHNIAGVALGEYAFIAHGTTSSRLARTIYLTEAASSYDPQLVLGGVAKTGGSENQAIEVYVPA